MHYSQSVSWFSNSHLSEWPVWLEHRPEAEVHGEWLYCLVLYLSLSGLESAVGYGSIRLESLSSSLAFHFLCQQSLVQHLGRFQVRWQLFKHPSISKGALTNIKEALSLVGLGFIVDTMWLQCPQTNEHFAVFETTNDTNEPGCFPSCFKEDRCKCQL